MRNWYDLLPEDSDLDLWQRCVKQAIMEIQKRRVKYGRPKRRDSIQHSGCIKNRYHDGERVMRVGMPPRSYCSGAVMEAFLLAWHIYVEAFKNKVRETYLSYLDAYSTWIESGEMKPLSEEEQAKLEEIDISHRQMMTLYRYFYVYEHRTGRYDNGVQKGLLRLSEMSPDIVVRASDDPNELPFGAFVQIQFGPDAPNQGHSAIVIGHGTYQGKGVLIVWSSNYGYRHVISKEGESYLVKDGKQRPSGHDFDWFYKRMIEDYPSGSFERQFYGAWIEDVEARNPFAKQEKEMLVRRKEEELEKAKEGLKNVDDELLAVLEEEVIAKLEDEIGLKFEE